MEENFFKLSRNKIQYLFSYFIVLLIIGIVLSIYSLTHIASCKELHITIASLIGSAGTAFMGVTIFYMRKLYKSLITNALSKPEDSIDKIKEFGLFVYYLLRPVFAFSFSIVFHIGLKASVAIVSVKESNLAVGMVYLTMFTSFFIGFATGDILNKLEDYSRSIVNSTMKGAE